MAHAHAMHAGHDGGHSQQHTLKGHDDGKLTAVKHPPVNMDKHTGKRGGKHGKHAVHHHGGHHLHGAGHMRSGSR